MSEVTEHLEKLVKDRLCLKHINIDENIGNNINKVLPIIMETVEFSKLPGSEKKEMSKNIFKNLVNKTQLNDDIKNTVNDIVDSSFFSQSIDMVIDACNKHINIKKNSCLSKILKIICKK